MTNKVSIIVPVYNTKKEYLEECFKSINRQKYKNIEVVIVDDGSEEEIALFLDTYNKFENYKVFHKKNEGVSTARNFGIENATGEWLMFMDSDDLLSDNAVEPLINNSESMDIVIGTVKRTNVNNVINIENRVLEDEEKYDLIKSIFQAKSSKYYYVDSLCGKLYKKSFWETNNLKLEKDLKYGEDSFINIEAYIKAKKINFLPELVYFWRANEESVTSKYNPKLMDEQEKTLNKIKDKFPQIIETYEKEFISYVSKAIKNIIENMYCSKECTKECRIELLKKIESKPVFIECINSNLYSEVPLERKIMLKLLKFRLYGIAGTLVRIYKKIKKQKIGGQIERRTN